MEENKTIEERVLQEESENLYFNIFTLQQHKQNLKNLKISKYTDLIRKKVLHKYIKDEKPVYDYVEVISWNDSQSKYLVISLTDNCQFMTLPIKLQIPSEQFLKDLQTYKSCIEMLQSINNFFVKNEIKSEWTEEFQENSDKQKVGRLERSYMIKPFKK